MTKMFPSQFRNNWAVLAPCTQLLLQLLCAQLDPWGRPGFSRQPGCVSLQRDPCVTLLRSHCQPLRRVWHLSSASSLPGPAPTTPQHLFGMWDGSDSFLRTQRGFASRGGRASRRSPGEGEQSRSVLPLPSGPGSRRCSRNLAAGRSPPSPPHPLPFGCL